MEEQINKFDKYIGSRHKRIKFKNELEKDSCITFLDVLVTNKRNSFITSLYRKPTFSGIYFNFDSHVPLVYKKGLIFCLLFRIYNICSLWSLIHEGISKFKCILVKNKYPVDLINLCIAKYLDTLFCKRASVANVPLKETRVDPHF